MKRLTVNRPRDVGEREADQVRRSLTLGAPVGVRPARAAIAPVRAAASRDGDWLAPPEVHAVLNAPGKPLDGETRFFFGGQLGHDFSKVRVHDDVPAAESAQAIRARAYTAGSHVVFGRGEYLPGTERGQTLLAHELTHVVQQSGGAPVQVQRWDMDNAPIGDPARDPRLAGMRPQTGITVTAIDDVDAVGWIESFLTFGEINFVDVNSMVNNILSAIGAGRMRRLNIQVHGSPYAAYIGNTQVTESNFATYQPQLARLAGHFTSDGFVHLRACDVGQNLPLMRLFAATFGVPVYAGRGRQSNIIGVNLGYIVRCQPDGTCTTQFFQP